MKHDAWPQSRRQVVLAFWATVLLGLPFWYFTTRVSRAALPILPDFADFRPSIGLQIQGLSSDSQERVLQGLNRAQAVHRYVQTSNDESYRINWHESGDFRAEIGNGRELQLNSNAHQSQNLEASITAFILKIFRDEAARASSTVPADLRVVKHNPAFELVFSLLNGGGNQPIKAWNIEAIMAKHTNTMLMTNLAAFSNFTIESQVQFNADLMLEPVFDESTGNHVIQSSALKNFINSAEWNLASAQSESKPLNFIVYVPRPEQRPMVIQDQEELVASNSFILPQFGSIIIYNPPENSYDAFDERDLAHLVDGFINHLLVLMGLPDISDSLGDASLWRLDGLLRQRLVETVLSAQETLQSITKVVDQIPNMHVPAHVATLIEHSLASLSEARNHAAKTQTREALMHAREAVRYAEEAFFDEKMVSLLYFPDEHKYGVYMPLFGPLLLPLIMAGLREIKAYRASRKSIKAV